MSKNREKTAKNFEGFVKLKNYGGVLIYDKKISHWTRQPKTCEYQIKGRSYSVCCHETCGELTKQEYMSLIDDLRF